MDGVQGFDMRVTVAHRETLGTFGLIASMRPACAHMFPVMFPVTFRVTSGYVTRNVPRSTVSAAPRPRRK